MEAYRACNVVEEPSFVLSVLLDVPDIELPPSEVAHDDQEVILPMHWLSDIAAFIVLEVSPAAALDACLAGLSDWVVLRSILIDERVRVREACGSLDAALLQTALVLSRQLLRILLQIGVSDALGYLEGGRLICTHDLLPSLVELLCLIRENT
jgi:hypothetical protein